MDKQNQSIIPKQHQQQIFNHTQQQRLNILQLPLPELIESLKYQELRIPFLEIQGPTISTVGHYNTIDWVKDTEQSSPYWQVYQQINLALVSPKTKQIFLALFSHIMDNGYLDDEWITVKKQFDLSNEEIEKIIIQFQQLYVPGFAARNIQESLYLQARMNSSRPPHTLTIIQKYFTLLVDHKVSRLLQLTGIDIHELRKIYEFLKNLSPSPAQMTSIKQNSILPEIVVKLTDNQVVTRLIPRNTIKLSFNIDNLESISDLAAKQFIQHQYQMFLNLKNNYQQRKKTLLLVSQTIVTHQQKFFLQSDHTLEPLKIKTIANELHFNESTISRAINGKYLTSTLGTFPLRYFVQTQVSNIYSQDKVLNIIQELIENESTINPLSDNDLVNLLQNQGITIARRTVAKYRNKLGILNQNKRKFLK